MIGFRKIEIDAVFEEICERGLTPHVTVVAEYPGAVVPVEFVNEGTIVLNLSNAAVSNFHCDEDGFMYSARFKGISQTVVIPYGSILSIFPKEHPEYGTLHTIMVPAKPVVEEPVLKAAPEVHDGVPFINPNAHVGWEKSAYIVK